MLPRRRCPRVSPPFPPCYTPPPSIMRIICNTCGTDDPHDRVWSRLSTGQVHFSWHQCRPAATVAGMSLSPLARIARFARHRHGVFTPAEAETVGVSRTSIGRMARRGEVERLAPGVYALTSIPDSWERRARAALLIGGPSSVLSHGAAARVLSLQHLRIGRSPAIELTHPRGSRLREASVATHESQILASGDVADVGCFRVTSPLFTIGAMAIRRAPVVIAKALDAAIVDGRFTVDDVRALVVRMWHTPGVVNLREAILLLTPSAEMTRSEMERLFLRICEIFGLPLPEADVRVVDADGNVRYLDFLFRDVGLAVEINAHPSHGTTLGRRLDGSRQNALSSQFRFLNYDADDLLQRPDVVAKEVQQALDELGSASTLR